MSDRGRGTAPVRWIPALWWVTTRRRWKEQTGALLVAGGGAVGLAVATARAPEGGEPLYLSVLLLLGCGALLFAPMLLTGENVLGSRRMDLLPLGGGVRWGARVALGNPLRTLLAATLLVWGAAAAALAGGGARAALDGFQLLAVVAAAVAGSQLLEDVVRHGRAVVVHQLAFFFVLASWPLLLDYLTDRSNFLPTPAWAASALAPWLFTGRGPVAVEGIAAAVPLALAAALFVADRWYIARRAARPDGPPASPRWTGGLAGALAAPFGGDPLLRKEIVVPLRFLFLRMSVVLIVVSSAAAFVWGLPWLLLSIAFWWQPLSTNALGPDVGEGEVRYRLMGWHPSAVLGRRLAAALLLSAGAIALAAAGSALLGRMAVPTVGPPSRTVYALAAGYGLSLLALWAVAGDRYSLRYPDALEMHTLLPERKRSAGAGALVMITALWTGVGLTALVGAGLALAAVRAVVGAPLGLPGLAAAATLAAAFNAAIYAAHASRRRPGDV